MSIIVKFGFRHYEFENHSDLVVARSLWAKPGGQDAFEDSLEKKDIDFLYPDLYDIGLYDIEECENE